jgi:hypothetical protein
MDETPILIHSFLSFVFGEPQLKPGGWLTNQLSTIFDIQFVEDKLLQDMRMYLPQMTVLLADLTKKVEGPQIQELSITKEHKCTVPEPFDLTETKFRPLPLPSVVMIADPIKANPIPETTYNNTLDDILKKSDERKEQLREEAIKAQKSAPTFSFAATLPKREVDVVAPPEIPVIKARPVPKFPAPPEHKKTAGAILREEALYRKKAEEEAIKLRRIETELRDESEFYQYDYVLSSEY